MDTSATEPTPPVATSDTVQGITDFLADDLAEVGQLLHDTIDSDSRLIREVGEYVSLTQGKKLRPAMVLLTHQSLEPEGRAPVEIATAVELIHVATLIHDDVIDKASTRRGKPSVNAQWGDDVAILMADFLYARAFDLTLMTLSPELMRLITQVTQKMCEGEMFQIEWRGQELTRRHYMEVVQRKTGQLFAACTALGALVAKAQDSQIAAAQSYGMNFGVAFQITDDILDFSAHDERWGKDIGMDASGCKQTLPVLMALEHATDAERAQVESWRGNGHDENSHLAELLEIIRRTEGIERAQEIAREYASNAAAQLDPLGSTGEAAEFLRELPAYVTDRLF